jgi:hypothetical protein
VIVETLRVAFIFVILPWVVGHRLSHFIHRKRFPYAPDRPDSDFPDSPLAYLLRAMPEPVWKPTAGSGGPEQTSNLSISVKSKSIRLIFGRIDSSPRVLETQSKNLR